MVMPEVHIGPPPNSNQTPVGPGQPWPLGGVPQQIKTWIPHSTPSVDNYTHALDAGSDEAAWRKWDDVGVARHINTYIPTNLPPGVYPGSYGFIIEPKYPGGIKQLTTNPYLIPKELQDNRGIYPGSYGKKKSYGLDAGSLLGGLVVGFVAGAVIFTATGRGLARATASRATSYIQPKR
jgi:hypothetical protein